MTPVTNADRAPARPGPGGRPPESVALLKMLTAPWIAQALYVVAEFDLADRLESGPATADDLAAASGLHPAAVYRFLRTLASVGVFTEVEPHTFALTPLGRFMCTDTPGSMKHSALLFGAETFRSWAEVAYTAKTGLPGFDKVYGKPFYDYLADRPALASVFNRVVGGGAAGLVPPVVRELPLADCQHVVDVGGGTGALLAEVLGQHDQLSGTLVDLPAAVADAPKILAEAGVSQRCDVVAGSFFDELPSGADAYLLARVLHNWNDDDAVRILRNVHTAMAGKGQLIIVERLLPAGDEYHFGKIFDLVMMAVLGGRDRNISEYERLLVAAGFEMVDRLTDVGELGALIARPVIQNK
jgi:SAM-dependent methyltransferase